MVVVSVGGATTNGGGAGPFLACDGDLDCTVGGLGLTVAGGGLNRPDIKPLKQKTCTFYVYLFLAENGLLLGPFSQIQQH